MGDMDDIHDMDDMDMLCMCSCDMGVRHVYNIHTLSSRVMFILSFRWLSHCFAIFTSLSSFAIFSLSLVTWVGDMGDMGG